MVTDNPDLPAFLWQHLLQGNQNALIERALVHCKLAGGTELGFPLRMMGDALIVELVPAEYEPIHLVLLDKSHHGPKRRPVYIRVM
jgi:hypothetical protein